MKTTGSLGLFLALCFFSGALWGAVDQAAPSTCQTLLSSSGFKSHEYLIIPSGRGKDDDLVPRYRKFVQKMSEPGGVLDQLGIPRTKQVVEFLSGVDMRAITSTPAAQPMAHFWDGAEIVKSAANPMGLVYEVVFPGPDYHHGYYRDDNPFEQQLSILMHVIGHNHFAVTSHFPHYRASNAPQSAIDFNRVMMKAYERAPKEEVESYYMFLQTLLDLDDNYSAFFRTPEDFDLEDLDQEVSPTKGDNEALKKDRAIRSRGIKSPTENILNAMVHRILKSDAAKWKKDMARLLPKLAPYRPALPHSQVMNEGWASLMQEIIMDHMGPEYNTMDHWLSALLATRSDPALNIRDPYWLGVRAWRRLRERFNEGLEVGPLKTAIEKDRAFIEYASHIIATMDDFQFLNEALDDYMIQGMGLALTRRATEEEAQHLPPPPQNMPNPQPKIVVSKDPERIRKAIIYNAVSVKTMYRPRVKLSSFNRNQSGEVELSVDGDFGLYLPIDRQSIAPALYALAQSVNQPVSFEAAFLITAPSFKDKFYAGGGEESQPHRSKNLEVARLRLVVTPAGTLRVFDANSDTELSVTDENFLYLERTLHEHLKELHMDDPGQMEFFESEHPRFDRLAMQAINQMINGLPVTSLIEHVPNAADAITEYQAKVAARLSKAFDRALNGKGGLKKTSKGLFLKALPSPKNIQFDMQILQQFLESIPPTGVDPAMVTPAAVSSAVASLPFDGKPFDGKFFLDGDSVSDVVGPVDLAPGRGGWAPGPSPRGGGGEEGEEEEEPGGGFEPGEETLDPTWVPIPEDLYAQFLGEKVKLPNLKPKAGSVKSRKLRLRKVQNRRHGHLMVGPTAANALKKGLGAKKAHQEFGSELGSAGVDEDSGGASDGGSNGAVTALDVSDIDLTETLQLGFSLMRPKDFVVKKTKPINKPDTNAVVFFVRDASGSTVAYESLYKRFVFDMKALIKSNYKQVKFVYIVFDTQAHVMESEAQFFKAVLGGGTSYKVAVDKTLEVMEEHYPQKDWDRFPFVIGDLGDSFTPETQASYERMIELSSFSGTVKGGYGVEDFKAAMEKMAEENKFFGFTDMGENPQGYSLEHLRELLKNEEP